MICDFPGCVAAALEGHRLCYVHLHKLGRPCGVCKGKGERWYGGGGVLGATPGSRVCDQCAGTGLADAARRSTPEGTQNAAAVVDERGLIVRAEGS